MSRTTVSPTGLAVVDERDIAWGWIFGSEPRTPTTARPDPDPVRALRDALRPALLHPPCIISFSGGRDSSLLLAIGADLAAREGHDPPLAVTFRYPGDDSADESSWQQLVIEHLRDRRVPFGWECQDIADEFDLIGSLTAPILRAHGGPLWPPSIAPTILLAQWARGGTVVTGEFGDEVLGPHRATYVAGALRRRGRGLRLADWRVVLTSAAPSAVRHVLHRDQHDQCPWLRPPVRRERAALLAADEALRPLRWDTSVRAMLNRRAVTIGLETMQRIALRFACQLSHPLGLPAFVDSYAAYGGRWGVRGRATGMRLLADGLLPEAIIRRTSKSFFNGSRFGRHTREFLASWTGNGLNDQLVDVEALRDVWTADFIPAESALLLQQAWLADQADPTGAGR